MQSITTCAFKACDRPVSSRGYCKSHYEQERRGKPLAKLRNELTTVERMEAATDKSGDCWEWTLSRTAAGYGQISIGDRMKLAHRVAFALASGPIPDGAEVDHRCHNPGCVRPEHLHTVTHKQNIENRKGATKTSASGVRGVYLHRASGLWHGRVYHNGRAYSVGYFHSIADAERAVIAKRNELFTNNLADR